jgi:isopentenyl-diphosphate delta-isomerase
MTDRKKDHISLAFQARTGRDELDRRFDYEPLLSRLPKGELKPFSFLGKTVTTPIWISSMTGGTALAGKINKNLAMACREFGMGMGLGSCRPILFSDEHLADFDVREFIGENLPLYANLGIAQLEEIVLKGDITPIDSMVSKLRADGLIIHVNPMQEWLQPEGDQITQPPLDTISTFLEMASYPVIVKEVGQGMGPRSLKALLQLPLEAVEFAAFGGTNFAQVELLRSDESKQAFYGPLSKVGHDAFEMTQMVNRIVAEDDVKCRQIIISGGVNSFLDGYYLIQQCNLPSVYGQASAFLKHAKESYEQLREFVHYQVEGLKISHAFFKIKESDQ